MRFFLRLAVLVPALLLLPFVEAQNTDKDKDKPAVDETKIRAGLVNGKDGYIQGKLMAYDLEKKEFTVQYVHQTKKANPAGQKKLNQILAQARVLAAQKNNAALEQLRPQYMAAQQEAWDVTETPIVFECVGDKNLVFRTLQAPIDPDTGKPKKLTPAEEKKAKGDDAKSPGYAFDPKDLDNEMLVRVYIDKAKYKPAAPSKDPKKDDKKDPKKDEKKVDAKDEKKDAKDEKKDEKKKVAIVTGDKRDEKKDADKDKDKKDAKKDDKKDADKDKDKDKDEEKVVYPINMIVIVPPPPEAAGAGNPFLKGGK